jgi:hypothetical protein
VEDDPSTPGDGYFSGVGSYPNAGINVGTVQVNSGILSGISGADSPGIQSTGMSISSGTVLGFANDTTYAIDSPISISGGYIFSCGTSGENYPFSSNPTGSGVGGAFSNSEVPSSGLTLGSNLDITNLWQHLTIPTGVTLTVPAGKVLVIGANSDNNGSNNTLTVNGTLKIDGGTVYNFGTIDGSGTVEGAVEGKPPDGPRVVTP